MGRTKEQTVEFHSPKDLGLDYINCWGEDHKAAKILILGTDPTAPVQGGVSVKNIHYPFGLESFDDGKSFSGNPYFRSIYYNLAKLLDKDVDIEIDKFVREKVIVMNAVDQLLYDNERKRYITTGECFQRKGNRERWIEQFHQGGTKEKIQEIAKGKLVLLTSGYLLECFGDNVREEGKGITGHYPDDLPSCFCHKENLWGADIALLYRHYRYKLNVDDNGLYKKWLKEEYKHIFELTY